MEWREVLTILWFFLPAGLANTTATLSASVPGLKHLNKPIDFGRSWRGVRIFGDHKTFRGLILATIIAAVVGLFQKLAVNEWEWLADHLTIDYNQFSLLGIVAIGSLQGCAALMGDAIKSFFKRRVGIPPGGQWFPFDQIDFLIAANLVMLPFVQFSLTAYLALFLGFITLHRLTSVIGYFLGLKDVPY